MSVFRDPRLESCIEEHMFSMPGPPLSQDSALVHLLQHNVSVGLGVMGINTNTQISAWSARNTRFDVSWVCNFVSVNDRVLANTSL